MTYTQGYTTYSSYKSEATECHWGNPLVFTTHDGIEVYAGGSSRGGGWWKMNPLPEFAMGPDNEVKKGYSQLKVDTKGKNMEGWKCMQVLSERQPPAVLEMDFPDYNVPRDCDVDFWEALAIDLREQGITRVHAMCMGGHGRTGIQLACLRWHLATEEERKAWPDANALISEIRTHYCNKAVEADKQQVYVAQMCGIPVGDILSFHKGGYGTTTKKSTSTTTIVKSTSSNRSLLECDECDLVMWEDEENHEIKEGDLCYDHCCNGHMQDITEFAVKRHFLSDIHSYQLCLSTLDVCSDVSAYQLGVLSEALMEKMHGDTWRKILDRLMSKNGKNSVRGKLLRNLKDELKNPTADNVLVVIDEATTCELVKDFRFIDYSKRQETGGKQWAKCHFCDVSTSPDRLCVAFRSDSKGKSEAVRACPSCVSASGMELVDRLEAVTTNVVEIQKVDMSSTTYGDFASEDNLYTIVEGLSPNHAYKIGNLRDQNKAKAAKIDLDLDDLIDEQGVVDDKEIREGLLELGLTDAEIDAEIEKKQKEHPLENYDVSDWDDWDDDEYSFI
tara:strand:+ start:1374 stop:3050 length:1677 start_codon:yes stop_codon:yes gene_type:complete